MQKPLQTTWLIAAAAFALLWLAIAFVPAPVSSSDWAAWVQGIGTIAAVGVAAWAGRLPLESAQKQQEITRAEFLERVVAACSHAFEWADLAMFAVDHRQWRTLIASLEVMSMHHPLDMLDGVLAEPHKPWPTAACELQTRQFRGAMSDLMALDVSEVSSDSLSNPAASWHSAYAAVRELREAQKLLWSTMSEVIGRPLPAPPTRGSENRPAPSWDRD